MKGKGVVNGSEWRRLDGLLLFALGLYRWLLVFQVSHFLQVWGMLRSRFMLSLDAFVCVSSSFCRQGKFLFSIS